MKHLRSHPFAALVCAASLVFCFVTGLAKVRQPPQGAELPAGCDFAVIYTGGRCWLEERPAYQPAVFGETFRRVTPPEVWQRLHPDVVAGGWPYPPNALPIIGAVAAVSGSWEEALLLWWCLSFAAVVLILVLSAECVVPHWSPAAKLWFIAALAQSRIIHLSSYRGQTGLFVFALVMLAVWLALRRRGAAGGLLLGLSMMKFTFAIPMIAFFGLRGRWKLLLSTVAITVLMLALGLARVGGAQALSEYSAVSRSNLEHGGFFDTSPANPISAGIDNVDVPLFRLLGYQPGLVTAIHYGLLALIVFTILAYRRGSYAGLEDRHGTWLEWSAWTLVGYLFLYHRFYDAVVLWPIAALFLDLLRFRRGGSGWVLVGGAALALLLFVLSIQSIDGRVSAAIERVPGFAAFSNAHIPLLLVVLACVLRLLPTRPDESEAGGGRFGILNVI